MNAPLPVHPVTGRTALGWRKARPDEDQERLYPIWPIAGGDGSDDDGQDDDSDDGRDDGDDQDGDGGDGGQDDGTDDGQGDDDPEGADQLGDKGKQALGRMKAKLKAERDRRKAAETERDQLKGKPGQDTDPDRIRAEADRAATARANARIVRSEIKAAAAGKLADPRDALTFIDLDQFEVDEDGQVDEDEVADAIDDLVSRKPYLAAATAKRFQGTGDGGARKGRSGPKQLTEQDVKKMTPEQIDEAHRKGELRDYLGG